MSESSFALCNNKDLTNVCDCVSEGDGFPSMLSKVRLSALAQVEPILTVDPLSRKRRDMFAKHTERC